MPPTSRQYLRRRIGRTSGDPHPTPVSVSLQQFARLGFVEGAEVLVYQSATSPHRIIVELVNEAKDDPEHNHYDPAHVARCISCMRRFTMERQPPGGPYDR